MAESGVWIVVGVAELVFDPVLLCAIVGLVIVQILDSWRDITAYVDRLC